jgi:hypothetical protein
VRDPATEVYLIRPLEEFFSNIMDRRNTSWHDSNERAVLRRIFSLMVYKWVVPDDSEWG